jgi:hypothetical protein
MKLKALSASLIFLMLVLAQTFLATSVFSASAATSTSATASLKIFAGPTNVPADSQNYNIIAVALQDNRGTPLRATQDTEVRLSSSSTNVGGVDETITIPKGATTTSANFYATYTPGTTSITATASGYPTAQVTITTVAPVPTAIAVYAFPPILPADGSTYQALFVQLLDASGSPAKAPAGGIQVTLSSSNGSIAAVDSDVTIQEGTTYASGNVKTNAAGTATVTASASGYTAAKATFTTQVPVTAPTAVKVYLAMPKVLPDGSRYQQIAVELQDSRGKLSLSNQDVTVMLTSSNTAVATIDSTITISATQSFALATFTTTYKSGTTTITAAATNYTSNSATVATTGPVPTKLAVFTLPAALPADAQAYDIIRVQLQDSRGKPALDPVGDTTVYLSTSAPDSGNVTASLTIPFGQTQATGTFTSTCAAGISTITAQASGYDSGTGKITTYLIDAVFLNVTVTADPAAIMPGNKTTIRAYVSYNGTGPALRAAVNFTSNKGGNLTATREEGNGYYSTTYTAPRSTTPTVCTLTANATKTGYTGTAGKVQVTVDLNFAQPKGTLQLRVVEPSGAPVTEATVTSQTQPAGVQALTSTTNASGYVTFPNIPDGSYTLQIAKEGYETMTQTLQFARNQTASPTVNLPKAQESIFSLPLIGGIVAAIVVSIVVVMLMRKRRSAKVEAEDPQDEKVKKRKK